MRNREKYWVASLVASAILSPATRVQAAQQNSSVSETPVATEPQPQRPTGGAATGITLGQAEQDSTVSELVVTGTRLGSGYSAPTPVVVQSALELQAAAPATLSDALNQLPAFKNSSSSSNAGISAVRGNGASLLNLRGLEPQRTLVLLDGRRVVSSSASGSPDVNLFPQILVSRVEVVTGGASAAYGSDAVAGVVNFILDKKFSGLKASVQAGISSRDDGANHGASVAVGTPFGNGGHFLASTEYFRQDEIGPPGGRAFADGGYAIVVNPSGPPTRLIAPSRSSNATFGGLIVGGPLDSTQFLPGGVAAPFLKGAAVTSTTMIGGDGPLAEYGLTAGLERWSNFARASYQLSPELEVYAEGGYAVSKASFDITRPTQTGATAFTIFSDNAYLPASIRSAMAAANISSFKLGRIDRDFGYAKADGKSETWRITGGFTWQLPAGWELEGYYAHGRNNYTVQTKDNTIHRNVFAAADAVINPANGQIVCRSTLAGLDPGCVPLNLFGDGSVSSASLNYVRGTAVQDLRLDQDVASLTGRGSPFSTWAGKVSIAAGFEYRREAAVQTSDALSQTVASGAGLRGFPTALNGQLGSFFLSNPQPLTGKYDIKEGFFEAEVPLLSDIAFAKSLSINGAVRLVQYSTVGSVTVWKIGGSYEPFADLRFRATRSRDIRAANIAELFSSPVSTQGTVISNGASTAWLGKRSGNRDLQPEEADTTTVGAVYRPSWFPGLNLTLDYFDINLKGAITQLTAQQTVDQCAASFAPACAQISTINGQLFIQIPTLNIASIQTRGIDFEASMVKPVASGQLRLRTLVSYLDKLETSFPGVAPIDRAGDIGLSGTPHWTANLTASYAADNFEVFVQERYIGPGKVDNAATPTTFSDNSVKAVAYTDLTLQFNVKLAASDVQLFGTINNLFDKQPPIVPTIPYGAYRGTNFSLYDVVGRYMTVGARMKF